MKYFHLGSVLIVSLLIPATGFTQPAEKPAQGEPSEKQDGAKSGSQSETAEPAKEDAAPAKKEAVEGGASKNEPSESGDASGAPSKQAASVTPPKLVSRKPTVECETLGFDVKKKVKLSLKIGEDGKTAEVTVTQGVDPACDAKVLEKRKGCHA